MSDHQWERIFAALSGDISDRRGLKWEWKKIDSGVLTGEISPAWRKIIEKELGEKQERRAEP